MRVDQVMSPHVRTCRPEDSLEQAAQLMWDYDCGCVAVCAPEGNNQLVGMLTDRDICMCALFKARPLAQIKVAESLPERQLYTCKPGDSLAHAQELMQKGRVRRLPVVDAEGRLVGLVALADLAREAARQQPLSEGDKDVTDVEINETLAAICSPPGTNVTGRQLSGG